MTDAIFKASFRSKKHGQKLGIMMAKVVPDDLEAIGSMLHAGTLVPAIDQRYALDEVPAAMHYVHKGHARGKVLVNVE